MTRRRKEHFWNAANAVTLARIAAGPVLLFLLLAPGRGASLLFGFIFLTIALTDLLDGWLARNWNMVTRTGKLLDPLADKLLITTAMIVLVALGRIPTWGVPLIVILLAREFAVTGLRAMASAEGVLLGASSMAKWKTGFQIAAVTCLLIHFPFVGLPTHELGLGLLLLATALALWSAWDYFAAFLGRPEDPEA